MCPLYHPNSYAKTRKSVQETYLNNNKITKKYSITQKLASKPQTRVHNEHDTNTTDKKSR